MNLWHHPRVLNVLANFFFVIALVCLTYAAGSWVVTRSQFSVWQVEVNAEQKVLPSNVKKLDVNAVRGSFFTVNLDAVRAEFSRLPWVRNVDVRRIWPNRLQVTLEEHKVLGVWEGNRLLNTHGEVFDANLAEAEAEGKLPQFSGPAGSQASVAARWAELNQWLQPLNNKPVALSLSERYAWTAKLENGSTLLLGRDGTREGTADHKDRVARMVEVLPQVASRLGEKPTQIDLRYPNGFAVRAPTQLAAWEQEQLRLKGAPVAKIAEKVAEKNSNNKTVKIGSSNEPRR